MRYDPQGDTEFQLDRILNGGIEFDDNLQGSIVEVEIEEGENLVEHNLGIVPIGWIIIFRDGEVELWATRQEDWTKDVMYLQSSASSVTVRLFVL